MARKKTSGVRKRTGSILTPKGKKGKASVKKSSPKKGDIRGIPAVPLSDEDTLPSGTDPFEDNGLGSPDCIPIPVKKKNAPVEIITLDNDDTIVTPDSKFLEMTFSEEDPKDGDQPVHHMSTKCGFDFGKSIELLSGSLKNQKLAPEPECNETFEMTFSVENIKKEPIDYDIDFGGGNSFSQDSSVKTWPEGKLLSADEIKKEVLDEDDVPLSVLCFGGKKLQVPPGENIVGQVSMPLKMDGLSEITSADSEGTLSSDYLVMIPNIKTEKIDLSDDPGTLSKTAKPAAKRTVTRAKKKSTNVVKELKRLKSNLDSTISNDKNSKNQVVSQNICDNSKSQFVPVKKDNVSDKRDTDVTLSSLNIKIKQEPLSDNEDCQKDTANNIQMPKVSKSVVNKSDSKLTVGSDTTSDSEPTVGSDIRSDSKSVVGSDIRSDSKSVVGSDIRSDSKSVVGSDIRSDSKSVVGSDIRSDSKSVVGSDIRSDSKLTVGSDIRSDSKLTVGSDIRSDSKLTVGSDIKSDSKSTVGSDIKSDSKSTVGSDIKSDSKSTVGSDIKSDSKSTVGSDIKSDSKSTVGSDIKSDSKSVVGSDIKSNSKSTVGSDIKSDSKSTVGPDIKSDSKSTGICDITVLSVKIKQEPLSDSEDATNEIDSGISDEPQSINSAEPDPAPSNSKAVVTDVPNKDNQPSEKETATSEMEESSVEVRSLVVTSASDEFRKVKHIPASAPNSNSGENSRQSTSSVAELLSKELAPVKNASLNFGTLEKLNPTERVAAEVISSLPAEKLQELIRGIAEARKLDLKPVLEESTAKSENDPAKQKELVDQENDKQAAVKCMKLKCELPESSKCSAVSQKSNAKTEENLNKQNSNSNVAGIKLNSSNSSDGINLDDNVSADKGSQIANPLPSNPDNKRTNPAIDMNRLMSAENLQNILKTASSLQDNGNVADHSHDEVLKSHHLTNSSVASELSNQTQLHDKDQKLLSSLSTDFLRTVIKTVEASVSQGKQSGDESCTTESSSRGISEPSSKQKHANLETLVVKQEKTSDICEDDRKGKNSEKIKTEEDSTDEYSDAKRCKTENLEDDYSQVSMECSQPSESENEEHPESNNRKKRRRRSRCRRSKRIKKEMFQDSCSKQSADEISPEKDNQLPKGDNQNSSSVKNEKVPPPKSLDTSEKSVLKPKSVRKKLNDSIVEVIKLSGKGQTVPSKGKASSGRELDHSKLKRKVTSPKRKSVDKESALFDVENDPDVVSSKASNKVQRFASRNEFLTKEMLPDDRFVKGSHKQNKFKWAKEKKNEPTNIQEGHLLVTSPEIDDIQFGDTGNKIEVVVRGGHVNNASHSLDPRLNRVNTFAGKHAKLNIEEYKEKYRNNMYGGSEFQKMLQMPVSTNNYNPIQQTVFQTNSYWNQSSNANPNPPSVEMTDSSAVRNSVFSAFQQPVATQSSFFPSNSPPVLPSTQPFVPNQGFNLRLQSILSPQNLQNMTSNVPAQPVPPTPQNLLNITQNPVQPLPPPAQNLPGVARNVPVQPVRPLQTLPPMTQKVPPVSPLSSTIPPLTFPPPPIRKHLPQQYPSISNVASPPPVDAAYSSHFQNASLRGCFPPPENSLPVQSFAPPLPPQPPPKVDVPPPPPLPPPDFFPPPPPASPPPDSSPAKSMSLASSSPSLSSPAPSPPLQFETNVVKSLSPEFSAVSKNSLSAKVMSSPHTTYSVEQHFTRGSSSTPEQLASRTPSSTPELLFSRSPSVELHDSTRDSLNFPKVSTQETNSVSTRLSVTSVDNNSQGRTQCNNPKFSSKSSFTFKDMTKGNSSSKDLLFLILSWSVSWLPQQIQIADPPPITEKVKPVEPSYACYKDYYDTYFPLLLHETWETIFLAWRQAKVVHYFCNVINHKPEGRLLEMQCNTIISSTTLNEGRYPAEGFLVIIKFGLLNSSGSTKMYGYVSRHSIRPFEIKSDFSNPCLKYLVHQPGEEVSVLELTIRTAYKCDKIDFTVLPRIQVVHSLKPILKQYDSLLNLRVSPLCKGILSADSALCKVVSLSKQKNPSTSSVVEEIASLILKPESAPQIIVIEALPGTDKINTLVKLIQRLKSAKPVKKKTQLLLCSRTNEVVDEVGCHLVLSQEEEDERKKVLCVRLGKMSDIHPEMRKYSLEDLAAKEVARVKKQQLVQPERELREAAQKCAKTEIDYKTLLKLSLKLAEKLNKQLGIERTILSKKQKQKERVLLEHTMCHQRYVSEAQSTIIKTSDVILSTVANCHQTEVDNACGRNSSMPLDCCIIDDASQCTELETLLPLLYGTSKLVLLGDPNISPRVLSKTASTYKYDLSYYQRVFSQVKVR